MSGMDIIEFLEASISNEEGRARIAAQHFPTTPHWWDFTQTLRSAADGDLRSGQALRHVDKHSPEQVLAECEAKRAIIAHFKTIDKTVDPAGRYNFAEKVLIPLARPYLNNLADLEGWTIDQSTDPQHTGSN